MARLGDLALLCRRNERQSDGKMERVRKAERLHSVSDGQA